MEENTKLIKAKKMNKVTEVVLKIAEIISTIGAITLIVAAIILMTGNPVLKKTEDENGEGHWKVESNSVGFEFSLIELDDRGALSELMKSSKSDIPFIQKKLDEGNTAFVGGIMFLIYGICLVDITVAILFLRLIFTKMNKAETPFTPEVLKQMKVSFIVIGSLLLVMTGSIIGVFAVLGLWSIYFIYEYAYSLQELADETI